MHTSKRRVKSGSHSMKRNINWRVILLLFLGVLAVSSARFVLCSSPEVRQTKEYVGTVLLMLATTTWFFLLLFQGKHRSKQKVRKRSQPSSSLSSSSPEQKAPSVGVDRATFMRMQVENELRIISDCGHILTHTSDLSTFDSRWGVLQTSLRRLSYFAGYSQCYPDCWEKICAMYSDLLASAVQRAIDKANELKTVAGRKNRYMKTIEKLSDFRVIGDNYSHAISEQKTRLQNMIDGLPDEPFQRLSSVYNDFNQILLSIPYIMLREDEKDVETL